MSDTLSRSPGDGVDWPLLLGSVVLCQLAGVVPAILTAEDVATWYPTLAQPSFTPPDWVFGPVWTVLYLLMGVSLYLVYRSDGGQTRRLALAAFGVQLVFNASWTLVFFGAHAIFGGLVVILALLGAILATVGLFVRIDRRAAALLVPYLLWVGYATALTYAFWQLN
ncbi:TspO protein [Halobacteriales archaeon QS_1_67_19]|nr:MAG: TspO protein [Halobacteriales archaeon QS_1_67_19]